MLVKIKANTPYADPRGPHLPHIEFTKGETVDVSAELAESIIKNKHGEPAGVPRETSTVKPESKEDGLTVDSKDEVRPNAYDALTPKKQRFVDEYLTDSDATAATIRAGYAKSNAESMGAKLLESEEIQAALAEKGVK